MVVKKGFTLQKVFYIESSLWKIEIFHLEVIPEVLTFWIEDLK